MVRRLVTLPLFLLLACSSAPPRPRSIVDQPLTLSVSPQFFAAPILRTEYLRVRVYVARHLDNRELTVALVDEAGELRVSSWQLDGAQAAVTQPSLVWSAPSAEGKYLVVAILRRVASSLRRQVAIQVGGGGVEDLP